MEPDVSRHSRPRPPEAVVARKRFAAFVAKMADAGVTQQELARRTGVPAQQISDVKHARRPMTEVVARRFGEQFGVDYDWFLGQDSSKEGGPGLDPMDAVARDPRGRAAEEQQVARLPVHIEPIEADPFDPARWGGGLIPVIGPAAVAAQASSRPYVLRVSEDDCRGRLKRGDMVLVLQEPNRTDVGNIGVIRSGGNLLLALAQGGGMENACRG